MRGQSWVVHVAHVLVSRGGQRVRKVVGRLPSPRAGSKGTEGATESAPDVFVEPSVPEASQSAAVFAESPLTGAEAATPKVIAETNEQPLDDSERTANTVGAEVAGTYGAHSGAAQDPNVVTSGPRGSEARYPTAPVAADASEPRSAEGAVRPERRNTDQEHAGSEASVDPPARWPANETLAFTPDTSIDLVDDIEFAFEPEADAEDVTDATRGWVKGDGSRECPELYPIKGNGTSHIYHLPGQASYAATIAETCFATEQDALENGFRPTKQNRTPT